MAISLRSTIFRFWGSRLTPREGVRSPRGSTSEWDGCRIAPRERWAPGIRLFASHLGAIQLPSSCDTSDSSSKVNPRWPPLGDWKPFFSFCWLEKRLSQRINRFRLHALLCLSTHLSSYFGPFLSLLGLDMQSNACRITYVELPSYCLSVHQSIALSITGSVDDRRFPVCVPCSHPLRFLSTCFLSVFDRAVNNGSKLA